MSERSLVMGTLPIVFLKNTSSMVDGPTERSAGRSRSSFPKRQGWVGYLKDIAGGVKNSLSLPFYVQPVQLVHTCDKWLLIKTRGSTVAPVFNYRGVQHEAYCLINFIMNRTNSHLQEMVQYGCETCMIVVDCCRWTDWLSDWLSWVLPGVNVTVESELCLVLQRSDGAGIAETPYLGVAMRRNCKTKARF